MVQTTYQRRRAAGQCGYCGTPSAGNCAGCKERLSAYQREKRKEQLRKGVCPRCKRRGYVPRPQQPGLFPFGAAA